MQPFTTLTGIAASLPMINVDTDMIIPKQYLKTIRRTGLGVYLFDELRHHPDGTEIADFVLNQEPFRRAQILISGANFGCGSSREHAVWSLLDFGIRAIIAPSFADIFFNNCFKNGVLPVVLSPDEVDALSVQSSYPHSEMTVDLESQVVRSRWRVVRDRDETHDGSAASATESQWQDYPFEVDALQRRHLLEGLDDIALTLQKLEAISHYESQQQARFPWLWTNK